MESDTHIPDALSPTALSPAAAAERAGAFLRAVYGWMVAGLVVTALTAGVVAANPGVVQEIVTNRVLFWALLIAQFGVVIFLSVRVQHLAPATAALLFLGYSALTGTTLSIVLLAFTGESVATMFLITAGSFGALALYGTVTRRELTGLGQFATMGLFGVVIASIVSLFWQNDMFQFILSVCGVITFTALTAWDAKRLKAMALALPDGRTGSYAVLGALKLYLDFINLFLFLLRLFGRRR
jgi:FtsH-binding integral membrane protein